ncbi:DUF2062 domain-containing protein [Rheinheimera pacifica]|uniref:DUF2062 domain-containing protein n=1 Tax=Rheinheimera pacifica TaxID=173990 RepID=A0A1H6M0Q4_9GAMM|nr:DUF2062 domain-containing protein [Rheinheimera pacifica]MDR6982584.1 uncharacterized protein (DUF2062 family) [Rheinheimera pacifica]PKM20360.1 MAG: DUF2062 domain-containing protein [Gammaproteobacteria bacterium HGW-Gammaproteobacteria-15]SEH94740.1 hypothetical protein SAMN05660691_02344 [Rheinheimera pacifica]
MPKNFIKKYLPSPEKIKQQKLLKIFGSLLHDGNLWHLNRRSARGAFAVGLFFAWMPIPFQMVASAAVAIPMRVNLPISVALVWLTNPITMPVLFYISYLVGSVVLRTPLEPFAFEASWDWLVHSIHTIGKPFLAGCLLMGICSAIIGYFVIDWLWRLSVRKAQLGKKLKRKNQPPL